MGTYELPGFDTVRTGAVTALLRRGVADELKGMSIIEPEAFLSHCAATSHRGRGTVLRATLPSGVTAIVRRCRRAGLAGLFCGGSYLMRPRPLLEVFVSETARRGGTPTPEVIAAVNVTTAAMIHSGFIVTREIEGAAPLREALAEQDGPEMLTGSVPLAVRALHDSGVAHHDLTVDNILTVGGDQAWVIDLDGCSASRGVNAARRLRNLRRFRRSAHKNGFAGDAELWGRFFAAYAGTDESLLKLKDVWVKSFERMLPWYRLGWRLRI